MDEDSIINHIENSLRNYNLRDIKVTSERNTVLASFILCSCFIDHVSGFRYNTEKVRKRFENFVRVYLPKYDPELLNDHLRNKLVHNYSLGSSYLLVRQAPGLHNTKNSQGQLYLNLEDFIKELEEAFDKFIFEINTNKVIRANAIKWFNSNKILALQQSR